MEDKQLGNDDTEGQVPRWRAIQVPWKAREKGISPRGGSQGEHQSLPGGSAWRGEGFRVEAGVGWGGAPVNPSPGGKR